MIPLAAGGNTVSTVPFWYVAVIAGSFTVFGVVLTLIATWLVARRKNRLDDLRRFEPDIIAAYIRYDEIADILHNNAGGHPVEENKIYWDIYREVLRIETKLQLIAPRPIFKLAADYTMIVRRFEKDGMSNIVDVLEEMRLQIRIHLRVSSSLEEIRRRRNNFMHEMGRSRLGRFLDWWFGHYNMIRDPAHRYYWLEERRAAKLKKLKAEHPDPPLGGFTDEPPPF